MKNNPVLYRFIILLVIGYLIYNLINTSNASIDDDIKCSCGHKDNILNKSTSQENFITSNPDMLDHIDTIKQDDLKLLESLETTIPPKQTNDIDNIIQSPTNTNEIIDQSLNIENKVSDSVYNFTPNDASLDNGIATFDTAFQSPDIPIVGNDSINLSKNNPSKYDVKDFLPKEINDKWFDTDFSQAKFNIKDDKLINTERYVIGVNTIGQSLKNASYDIRGTVVNPKFSVSPWNNSTYEADYNIKPLC